jgi:hypothetical protein
MIVIHNKNYSLFERAQFCKKPNGFSPPQAASAVEIMSFLMPTVPFSSPSDTRQTVAGIEVSSEAKFRGVHHLDRLLLGLEPKEARNVSEGFLARYGDVRDDVAQKRRLEEIAAAASPADREFGAL